MCGIAGFIGHDGQDGPARLADQMLADLHHRGPDDHGWLTWSPGRLDLGQGPVDHRPFRCALLHRRLAILDLSPSGRQPMSTADGRYHLTFNGEIYNYQELRVELERLGQRFRSTSDTEVLLAACAVWGPAMLPRLVGMFAFALLDTHERTLLLARDAFGIKPLHYTSGPNGFAFASELRPLVRLADVSRRVNPSRLLDYLHRGLTDHGAETFYADIQQLPAAHHLTIDLDHPQRPPQPVRWWTVDLDRRRELTFDEARLELRDRFLDSVRLHLRSDVPVGACLSGGIDSSAIVMAMRHLQGERLDLHTFSFVADDPALSEERWVDTVTAAGRTTVHKVRATADDLLGDLETLIRVQEVPFGSTSIYAQHRVFRLAAERGIKVMLDGQGADELFAGYRGFLTARTASLFRQGQWAAACRFLHRTAQLPGIGFRGMVQQLRGLPQLTAVRDRVKRLVRGPAGQPWLKADWFAERSARGVVLRPIAGPTVLRHELHRALVETSLPQLLRFEDRNSMAWSIESRVPFLVPSLAEFVFSLPEECLISPDGTSKWVFREAMRGIVPDGVLDRRDKIGFATPERTWLQALAGPIDGILHGATADRIGALDLPMVRRTWQAIRAGKQPWDHRVWRWVNLIEWARVAGADCA